MRTALMTASVKSRLLFQIWTCHMFPLMPRPKPQPSPFTPRALMNYLLMMSLLMMQPLTFRVTGMLLLVNKRKLLRMVPVSQKMYRS